MSNRDTQMKIALMREQGVTSRYFWYDEIDKLEKRLDKSKKTNRELRKRINKTLKILEHAYGLTYVNGENIDLFFKDIYSAIQILRGDNENENNSM